MLVESRERLAASQAEIMRSLALGASAPEGFDLGRIATAADSLVLKRARSVAHAWPTLARSLGESFTKRFAEYAQTMPLSWGSTPLADGHAFARALNRAGALPEDGKLELLTVDARYVLRGDGLVARRGIAIKAVWLKRHRRISIIVRLPLLAERRLELRFPWTATRQQTSLPKATESDARA